MADTTVSRSSPRPTRGRSSAARRWSSPRAGTSRRWRRTRCASGASPWCPAGSVDPAMPADLAPTADDPAGGDRERPHRRRDAQGDRAAPARARAGGRRSRRRRDATPVDYPDTAAAVAKAVARGEADAGIVIDGAGIGSAIAANKVRGIRAAMVHRRDDRALFARAQRRQRHDARLDAAAGPDAAMRSSTSGSARP